MFWSVFIANTSSVDGFFDYLNRKTSVNLLRNLRKLLKPEGRLFISNVRDKYSNPSVHFMEWVGDWNLVYREDDEFKKDIKL